MEETTYLSEVINKYEETFEKLIDFKSGKNVEESNEIQNKYKKYLKAFPIKLDNGDIIYFDIKDMKLEVKYKSALSGSIFRIDKSNIDKYDNIKIDKIKVPNYIFEDIFFNEENLDEDLSSIDDTFEFFNTYEQIIDSNTDYNNKDIIAINKSSNKIKEYIKILSEKLKEEEKEYNNNKHLYNKKNKLFNKYNQLIIEKDYLNYIVDSSLKISSALQIMNFYAFMVSIPINELLLKLPLNNIFVEIWISFSLLHIFAFPITGILRSPFVLVEKNILKRKYNSGEISEEAIMELKKEIEKNESNIIQINNLLEELHEARIQLFKTKVKKEYNLQLEKQKEIKQTQHISEPHSLVSNLNYAYAPNQSLALTNNKRY